MRRRSVEPRATAWRVAGEDAGGAQQVVGDRRAQDPGGVGAEPARRHVRQGPVDQVGEHGFDDRVLAVGDVGLRRRAGRCW